MEKRESLPSHAAQALQAHNSAKQSSQSHPPQSTDEIKSLNQLLQWATANSSDTKQEKSSRTSPPNDNSQTTSENLGSTRTAKQLKEDREWLDAAFPDAYAGLREIVALLDSSDSSIRVSALHELQEFFLDLNYAINIDKIGALEPILRLATINPESTEQQPSEEERAAAIWVLGTAMQHVSELKTLFVSNNVHKVIASALSSTNPPSVRAKAVMAASALLRNADPSTIEAFESVNGDVQLRARLSDDHAPTRRRARFFMMHASTSGYQSFVEKFLSDLNSVAAFSDSLKDLDVDDYADVETAVGVINVVIKEDLQGLLNVAPELPGVLDDLMDKCSDEDIKQMIRDVSAELL